MATGGLRAGAGPEAGGGATVGIRERSTELDRDLREEGVIVGDFPKHLSLFSLQYTSISHLDVGAVGFAGRWAGPFSSKEADLEMRGIPVGLGSEEGLGREEVAAEAGEVVVAPLEPPESDLLRSRTAVGRGKLDFGALFVVVSAAGA